MQQITHRSGPGDIIFSDQEFRYDEHGLVDRFWERSRVRNPSTGNSEYAHLREAYSHSADGQVQQRGQEKSPTTGGQSAITLSTTDSVDWDWVTTGGWTSGGNPSSSSGDIRDHRITSDERFEYTYDSEGNIRTRKEREREGYPPSDETLIYEWDHKNRLISVTEWIPNGDGQTGTGTQHLLAEYTYDYFGRRVRRIDQDWSVPEGHRYGTAYVYDGTELVAELELRSNASARIVRKYFNGPGVNEVIAVAGSHSLGASGGTVRMSTHQDVWYFADRQGTPRTLALYGGPAATPGEPWELLHRQFDSFGKLLGEYGGHTVDWQGQMVASGQLMEAPILWAGHVFDEEVGLYQMQARWFSPDSQRFLSQDPLGFAAGDHNLYRYTNNSPANLVDPDGRLAISASFLYWGGAALLGGLATRGVLSHVSSAYREADRMLAVPGGFPEHYYTQISYASSWHRIGNALGAVSFGLAAAPLLLPLGIYTVSSAGIGGASPALITRFGFSSGTIFGALNAASNPDNGLLGISFSGISGAAFGAIAPHAAITSLGGSAVGGIAGLARTGRFFGVEFHLGGLVGGLGGAAWQKNWHLLAYESFGGIIGAGAGYAHSRDQHSTILGASIGMAIGGFGTLNSTLSSVHIRSGRIADVYAEYLRFRSQGYTSRQAYRLLMEYSGEGQHFVYKSYINTLIKKYGADSRRGRILAAFRDSPFNLIAGNRLSTGRFYEYHARIHQIPKYRINSSAHNWAIPRAYGGGRWYYRNVLNQPPGWGRLAYIYHGSPFTAKFGFIGLTFGVGVGVNVAHNWITHE